MIISILNQKGGVGKTTTAVNLGAALAEADHRVLLIDLDAQGNATRLCGIKKPDLSIFDVLIDAESSNLRDAIVKTEIVGNLDIVPGARAMAGLDSALGDQPGREFLLSEVLAGETDYDFIVMDNGPSLGIAPAMSLCAADIALVPQQCEEMAAMGLAQVTSTVDVCRRRLNHKLQLRIVLTMIDNTTTGQRVEAEIRARFGAQVFATTIRRSEHFKQGISKGGSVLNYAPTSAAAASFRDLAAEISKARSVGALPCDAPSAGDAGQKSFRAAAKSIGGRQ